MKGFKGIPVKFKPTPITIKEPYNPEVKEFADTEEFTHYFRANEELFKEPSSDPDKPSHFLTTNKLNRTYKIPGYRIRIINKGFPYPLSCSVYNGIKINTKNDITYRLHISSNIIKGILILYYHNIL